MPASVTTHDGAAFSSDFLGQAYIVFFYPKANTPGCIAEVRNLRDYQELQDLGYQILGGER